MSHERSRLRSTCAALALCAGAFLAAFVSGGRLAAQDTAAPAADAPAETKDTLLRLKSGAIVFGQILAHDPDGIRVRMLETGGEIPLPWGVLDPTEADEMRQRYGYVQADSEELLVEADRIELASGKELVGRIVSRDETHLWVKRAEGTVPIPKTSVRGAITSVEAPALDIFTREELYQDKAFELQGRLAAAGRPGAQANDELAHFAERLFDYTHALAHYTRAAELDPNYEPARLTQDIARTQAKAALQKQVDQLAEIDLQRARKGYKKAIDLIAEFRTLYAKSPLLADLNQLAERVAKSQERDLREEIISRTHYWSVRLAREIAQKTNLEEVQAYLEEKMGEDLMLKVREDVQSIAPGIEVDQIKRLWGDRKGGKYRWATYSLGTWLIGEEARAELDQTKDKKEAEPPKGSAAEQRKKLEEKVKRYMDNQKLTRQGSDKPDDSEDPQAFWQTWNWAGRSQWVQARFAEKSGFFHDLQARFENCRECGGTGAREILFTGNAASAQNDGSGQSATAKAGEQLVICPACHHIGVVRRIRYR
jgi:hypothetical protein